MKDMISSHQADKNSPLANGRRTIACFSGSMSSNYMTGIILGACDYANQQGYNIIAFVGGPPNNPDPIGQVRDKIFESADPSMFEGLIVPLSSLSRYMSEQEIFDFMAPYRHLKVVTTNAVFEDFPMVTTDNHQGMRQLLEHLIEDHGYRKIAFTSGPENHSSSNEKLKIYIEMLEKHGIPYDPAYVTHGPISRESADVCLELLIDERKLEIDAIVSVNDNQAYGIINNLKDRGIRVPEDIAVTGCLDMMESSIFSPPLTTVHEPMYELGWLAAKAVIDGLEGRPVVSYILSPTHLVVRQSCGCTSSQAEHFRQQHIAKAADPDLIATDISVHSTLIDMLNKTAQMATQSTDTKVAPSKLESIAKAFQAVTTPEEMSPALLKLESAIHQSLRSEVVVAWLAIIPVIQRHINLVLSANARPEAMVELNQRIDSLNALMSQKAINYRAISSEKYIKAFRGVSAFLNAAFDGDMIQRQVVRELNASEFFLCVYEDKLNVRGAVKNVLAIHNRKVVKLPEASLRYPSSSLVPPGIETYQGAYALLVFPMTFRAEPIGYLVMDPFDRIGTIFENMVELFASALQTESQMQQLKDAEEKFSDIAFSASDWLWEVDEACRYTFCSEGVARVLGYSSADMIGRSLFDFVLPSQTAYLEFVKDYLIPNQMPLNNHENVNRHRNGRDITLSISGKPIIKDGQFKGYRGAFKDITEVKAQENQIRQLAYKDTLTNLPNRALFQDCLASTLESAERESGKFAVLFLDLDRFKFVNDTLGHAAGDVLLKAVAERLTTCVRDSDILARLGGDEFTIILSRVIHEKEVISVAQRIVDLLSAPFDILGNQIFVSTSVGIATFPNDGRNALELLKNADKAMYKAKEQGKNRFVFYNAHMNEKTHRRMQLESALHKAVQKRLFEVYFQPQVDAVSGKILGAETLLRLSTPELGVISPYEFIGLAEEIGLIEPIGLWVFETAARQAQAWATAGHPMRVGVNVSARQLKNVQLADDFIQIIERIGIEPSLMEIEITENAVIENEVAAGVILNKLSTYGLKIAIDDFGTGYSSLSNLKKFPIDTIKIDRSFIQDCCCNEDSAGLVSAIIQIAKSLRMHVIAEGVETPVQLNMLRTLSCPEVQGYLFSRPVPEQELTEILRTGFIQPAPP